MRTSLWDVLVKSVRSSSQHRLVGRASQIALISPQQNIRWSYDELYRKALGLSLGLQSRGVQAGTIVLTDLPNVAEGIVLQLACSKLGAAVATAKNAEQFQSMQLPPQQVRCAVVAPTPSDVDPSWLTRHKLAESAIVGASEEMESMLNSISSADDSNAFDETGSTQIDDLPLGYFGSARSLTQWEALHQGRAMVDHFDMQDTDKVCVSITLYHAFGIGSACSSALQSGATIVLPAVGGMFGCGVPSQRASVTLQTLSSERCSLLFADTHTIKALKDESLTQTLRESHLSEHLRGGMCKTGSGTEVLNETIDLAGVQLATLGKRP